MHTDEQLITEYLSGDESAFAELLRRHLDGVYTFSLRFVGNEHEAEDITQESFVKAWKSLKKYDTKTSKFKTWLMRIVRNTAIDHLRKKKHVPFSQFENEQGDNVLIDTLEDTSPLPEEMLSRAYDTEEVQRALEKMSPLHKEILLLYYTNDLTFEEIGAILNSPPNTVKSRHHRALQTLRPLLAPRYAL